MTSEFYVLFYVCRLETPDIGSIDDENFNGGGFRSSLHFELEKRVYYLHLRNNVKQVKIQSANLFHYKDNRNRVECK